MPPMFPRLVPVGVFSKDVPKSKRLREEEFAFVIKTRQLPLSFTTHTPVGAVRLPMFPKLVPVGVLEKLVVKSRRVIVLL